MWELDYKECWALKNWCFSTVVLEKTLESPLNCKEIQPVNTKGHQPWIFIRRTDAETEVPILWPCEAKSQLIGKKIDAGRDWGQEEKGATENERVRSITNSMGRSMSNQVILEGQGSLVCCSPWGHRVGHDLATEQQKQLIIMIFLCFAALCLPN